MDKNNKTSTDIGTISIWVSGGPENLLQRPMLSFTSQDRRIILYLPASIPADHKEEVMDSVSQKNYYLSFWKQLFKHT
jgi:hypothetical protein